MEIIPAEEKHIPEIVELWIEFMDFNAEINPYDTRGDDSQTQIENHLRSSIDSEDMLVLIALDGEDAVGYSISAVTKRPLFFRRRILGSFYDIFVNSRYRRRGIGKGMLKQILAWFKSRNVNRIELSVVAENTISRSFWESQGFKDYEHILYLENTD